MTRWRPLNCFAAGCVVIQKSWGNFSWIIRIKKAARKIIRGKNSSLCVWAVNESKVKIVTKEILREAINKRSRRAFHRVWHQYDSCMMQWFDIKKSKHLAKHDRNTKSNVKGFTLIIIENVFTPSQGEPNFWIFPWRLACERVDTYWRTRCDSLRSVEVFASEHHHSCMPNSIDLPTYDVKVKEKFFVRSTKHFHEDKHLPSINGDIMRAIPCVMS